jgi:signal transduction histidine kinase
MELAVLVGGRPGRRTVRDWLADLALFGVGLLFWGWGLYDLMVAPDPAYLALLTDWMIAIDPWLGLAACLALWWRRRFPLQLAVLMVPTLSLAGTSLGAVLVSILTVAIHRRWWQASLITAIQLGQSVLFVVSYQPAGVTVLQHLVTLVLLMTVPLVSGLVVRFRRELIVSLHQAAERQQEEHDRRLAEARRAERARIAREMHDVLAHRISLLSVHAGALAYRISQAEQRQAGLLTGEEITGAVEVIRENAHQALSELSEVLAVLAHDASDP